MPDHLGFGRSDKPADPELYRVPRHAERLDALLESLDLTGATVVPQDWGGPIGLCWATRHPERVAGLFVLNRTPILVSPRETRVAGDGPAAALTPGIAQRLKEHFRAKPVHITWAMKDVAFLPTYLETLWLDTFPETVRTTAAGERAYTDVPVTLADEAGSIRTKS